MAQVHGVRAQAAPLDRIGYLLAPSGQAGGGGASSGFCHLAGDCPPRRQTDIGQDSAEIRPAGGAVALHDVSIGVLRRPRWVGHRGDVQSGGGACAPAQILSQVGHSHTRSAEGVPRVPVGDGRGCHVARDAGHRLLWPPERRRDGSSAGDGDGPRGAPDAQRPQVLQVGGDGAALCGADDPQGQSNRRGQGHTGDPWQRRFNDRCGAGALGHGQSGPSPGRDGGDYASLPPSARHSGDDGRASLEDQGPDGGASASTRAGLGRTAFGSEARPPRLRRGCRRRRSARLAGGAAMCTRFTRA